MVKHFQKILKKESDIFLNVSTNFKEEFKDRYTGDLKEILLLAPGQNLHQDLMIAFHTQMSHLKI